MKLATFFQNLSLSTAVRAGNLKHDLRAAIINNPGVLLILFGLILTLLPDAVLAQGLAGAMNRWTDTLKAIVSFVMNIGVVVGVLAIFYGAKLVIDKSNDRENVKNSHIVVSFVGGALMCMLWFVVEMMSETVGDGSASFGESGW